MPRELLLHRGSRHQARGGQSAALTMGFMVRSSLSSMPITESNGKPVLFTPSFCRASSWPSVSHTSAKTNTLEMLWI